MNHKITFTVDPSGGQGDSPPIINPRLKPRGDWWVVAFDQPDNVTVISEMITVPGPPDPKEQRQRLTNRHVKAVVEVEAIANAMASLRAMIIVGSDKEELTAFVDLIINGVIDLFEVLA